MADLPSILGGMAQGFLDFGKSAVDLFGTGGASIADLIESARTGKVTTKNSDDFRKWLYDTNDVKDAAAKGLGTALNGVQTVSDYIPGIGAVTRNPLFNAGQGALGGLADEFKMYGKDYDLGRAGQRAAVSAGAALASGGLGDALKKSANPLLSSGAVQGLARGAAGGAISGGGYAAIDGGDIAQSALQGAGTGALIGGATGAIQDFMPRKATYDMALTDEEKAARIKNAQDMLVNEQNPERIAELHEQIKKYGGATAQPDYLGDEKYSKLVKKAKGYKSLDRFEKMNNPIKGSEIWGEKPKSYFERDSRAVRINMFPNDATKGTGLTKQYLLNMFKDAYDDGITDIVPSYGSYTKEGASFMNHLADQGWVKKNGINGYNSYEIAPKIAEWQKTNPLADIYNAANSTAPKALETTLANADMAVNNPQQPVLSGLASRLSGDQLADATDLENTLRGVGADIDDNGYVTLYHRTTPDAAASIYGSGEMTTKEPDRGIFWSTNRGADSSQGYGDSVVTAKVPVEKLELDDIFDNNADVVLGTNGKNRFNVSDYLVNADTPSLEQALSVGDAAINNVPDVMASKAVNDNDGSISVFTSDMDPKTRRALDIITNQDVPTENELYNRIDPETLPQGYEKLRNLIDNKVSIDEQVEKKLGKNPLKADVDELLDYLYPNEPLEKKVFHKSLNESIEKYKRDAAALGVDASKAAEDMTRTKKLELVKKIYDRVKFDTVADIGKGIDVGDDLLYATQAYNHRGIRTGYPGALDTALSERLEIAPGNTIKITDSQYDWTDDDFKRKNLGRYTRNAKDISVREGISGIEGDISTMAHERLHSFQNEARPENVGRYSKEVTDAYDELSKDLKPYIKDSDSVAKIYGASDTDYYASPIEQESRMLQTYLDNKGYTKDALFWRNKQNGGKPEWGNEINPAFDKFFDKLRDLSKRGVALPALTALFGGGALMANQQKDKEEVR